MYTDIVKPNFTRIDDMQSLWILSPYSCGRPPWGISTPILCTTSDDSIKDPWIIDQGTDYTMQSSCCPTRSLDQWVTYRTNSTGNSFFTARSNCPANYCYLTDEATAHAFGDCIEEASRKLIDKGRREGTLRNNATTAAGRKFNGTCEYIDYDALRGPAVQGIGYVKPKPQGSGAAQMDIWSVKAVVSVVGLGLVVVGSGLF